MDKCGSDDILRMSLQKRTKKKKKKGSDTEFRYTVDVERNMNLGDVAFR